MSIMLGLGMLAAYAALAPGCYRKVVSGRGLAADSEELRQAAARDPRVPERRIKRESLLGPAAEPPTSRDD
ncbi:MAG: hypothetical protein ACTS22_09140 [Phycisphaerales bacterium]